jgi:hypothetical protein
MLGDGIVDAVCGGLASVDADREGDALGICLHAARF